MNRYQRQELFAPLGKEGQERLSNSKAVIIGCGALGCQTANLLARAGVGTLRLIDRDIVELGNLHRQTIFSEGDARNGIPKAVAAQQYLRTDRKSVV